MNNDRVFTLGDIQEWIGELFYIPGDSFIYYLLDGHLEIAIFFEIDRTDYHGLLSGFISSVTWAFVARIGAFSVFLEDMRGLFEEYKKN